MKYKKVYIEITNHCNLSCDFCIQNIRKKEFLSREQFLQLLAKLKPYTEYLYFHVLGEPLLHPEIKDFLFLAKETGFKVNITTNGYLIEKIRKCTTIRQINISLHSFNPKYHISLDQYMNQIFNTLDDILPYTYVSLRLWTTSDYSASILEKINVRYQRNITMKEIEEKNIQVTHHLFLNTFHEFIWPDLKNNSYEVEGTCYGLIDHIGVLVDGTVVPCCLDSKGELSLGNLYKESMEDIIKKRRYEQMENGFRCHKKVEELCRHCKFIEG